MNHTPLRLSSAALLTLSLGLGCGRPAPSQSAEPPAQPDAEDAASTSGASPRDAGSDAAPGDPTGGDAPAALPEGPRLVLDDEGALSLDGEPAAPASTAGPGQIHPSLTAALGARGQSLGLTPGESDALIHLVLPPEARFGDLIPLLVASGRSGFGQVQIQLGQATPSPALALTRFRAPPSEGPAQGVETRLDLIVAHSRELAWDGGRGWIEPLPDAPLQVAAAVRFSVADPDPTPGLPGSMRGALGARDMGLPVDCDAVYPEGGLLTESCRRGQAESTPVSRLLMLGGPEMTCFLTTREPAFVPPAAIWVDELAGHLRALEAPTLAGVNLTASETVPLAALLALLPAFPAAEAPLPWLSPVPLADGPKWSCTGEEPNRRRLQPSAARWLGWQANQVSAMDMLERLSPR